MLAASADAERRSSAFEARAAGLDALIEVLRAQVAELEVRLVERDAVIAELKARLDQNSCNSSKPSSSDGSSSSAP